MIRQEEYGCEIDVWAAGVCAYSLLSASMPFVGDGGCEDLRGTYRKIVDRNMNFDGEAWEEVSDLAKSFIDQLLCVEPQKRPPAYLVMKHAWITTFADRGARERESEDSEEHEDESEDDHEAEDEADEEDVIDEPPPAAF